MGLDAEVGGGFGDSEGVSVEDGNSDVGNDRDRDGDSNGDGARNLDDGTDTDTEIVPSADDDADDSASVYENYNGDADPGIVELQHTFFNRLNHSSCFILETPITFYWRSFILNQ